MAIAEQDRFGGTCVIRGCIPKKLLVYASGIADTLEAGAGYGWRIEGAEFDWARFIASKNREIARLEAIYRAGLENAGVTILDSRAQVRGPHDIETDSGRRLSARYLLVATGGRPHVPDVPGRELVSVSDDFFELPARPARALIVGGGYIACEFACILAGLGAQVVQVYRGELILRGFDRGLREYAAREMRRQSVDLRFETEVVRVCRKDNKLAVELTAGRLDDLDLVLYATGRRPATVGIGLPEAGVELGRQGEVLVDEYSQSSVPSIYAIGDATNRLNQTPVAIREGEAFVRTVFRGEPTQPDHALVPLAVFTRPELATVGLGEEEARRCAEVEIYRSEFRPLFHTLSGIDEKAMVKLIVDRSTRRILGAHVGGYGAAEMMQCLAIAIRMGATKEDFDSTVALHPTTAEEIVTLREPVES